MIRAATRRARPGFTLVELMVAAAVCVLIMAILATAFQLGIDTMRQLKSTGDMMDQLRGATTSLRADLKAKHFLDANGVEVKLSDFRWDKCFVDTDPTKKKGDAGYYTKVRMKDALNNTVEWRAPENGFFRIGSAALGGANVDEGADTDGIRSGRYTNHYLHFTSVLGGLSDDDYYSATVRGKTYRSTAAEIAYFLDPNPSGGINGTTPLYRLVRRQRIVAVNDTDRRDRPWPPPPHDHAVMSMGQPNPTTAYLNTLGELTSPWNRLGGTRWVSSTAQVGPGYAPVGTSPELDKDLGPMASRPGEDTLLSNVISFEVQVVYAVPPPDNMLPVVTNPALYPRRFNTANAPDGTSDHPFDTFPPTKPPRGANTVVAAGTFDSWNQGYADWTSNINTTSGEVNSSDRVPPILARVQAVQIRIRIWDPKYQGARQVTIVQDL